MKRHLIMFSIGFLFVAGAVCGGLFWFTFRIYVPEDKCAVLIRKWGESLPAGQRIATEPGYKGIQEHVLGPGRYFRNPMIWEWELHDQTVIPPGDPKTWEWVHSMDPRRRQQLRDGSFKFDGDFPRIGVVTRRIGRTRAAADQVIVMRDSGEEGILEEVLTPGTYKLNPYVYEVELHDAAVIPAGFVGVVTNLFAQRDGAMVLAPETAPADAEESEAPMGVVRALARPGERGTLRDVLQPGVYFINPKLQRVTLIEIGYNEFSPVRQGDAQTYWIQFPSDTGYQIRLIVTVVWGIHPENAASIIHEFGNVDGVMEKVIGPQLLSICRQIGSTFAARDFIQGEQREVFQQEMTKQLQDECRSRNIEVLLALVREIEVHSPTAGDDASEITEDLKRTIQRSHIAIENQVTKEKQSEAARVKAQLEEVRKEVEIAKETITAQTRVLVAGIGADGEKEAARIGAEGELEIAGIQQEVARLEAKRTEILGQAGADVERMAKEAEAEGYRMLVNAFGSPRAYNLYTFAENFKPQSIRLFYAGEGTFWTDLSRFEEAGAARLLSGEGPERPVAGTRAAEPPGRRQVASPAEGNEAP